MALFSCFKQGFKSIGNINILILVAKKNTLNATETVKCFLCTFCHELWFSSHQFDAAALFKRKIFEAVCDGNFEPPEQVKFEKFIHLVSTMGAPTGSLNSPNQWLNDMSNHFIKAYFTASRNYIQIFTKTFRFKRIYCSKIKTRSKVKRLCLFWAYFWAFMSNTRN